ncbi:unnamed protein product [Protopolystoma xenopodis]|uniref:Uncharacterized protein n=1 Tax=Protopolystoma xenopodis TaxID=117903 RepID=A0A3S5C6C2_9PLAT|nr:unnamed protein product [Protopolystoma xenopodis]
MGGNILDEKAGRLAALLGQLGLGGDNTNYTLDETTVQHAEVYQDCLFGKASKIMTLRKSACLRSRPQTDKEKEDVQKEREKVRWGAPDMGERENGAVLPGRKGAQQPRLLAWLVGRRAPLIGGTDWPDSWDVPDVESSLIGRQSRPVCDTNPMGHLRGDRFDQRE